MSAPGPDCSRCFGPILGRAIHDEGAPWCQDCRKALIAERAARNADRYIRVDLAAAEVLAEIQRKPDEEAA